MKLTSAQIAFLDRVALGKATLVRDWRTRKALEDRGLITHNDATWKYPEPYYRLTDEGVKAWSAAVTEAGAKQ